MIVDPIRGRRPSFWGIVCPAAVTERTPPDPRIASAIRGDRRAAEQVLLELLPRVRNLIRYLLRGDGDVDDVAQEALLAVLRGLPTYRAEAPLPAWADRIVVRVTFDFLHRRRRRRQREQARAEADLGADLHAVPAPGERPDEYAARRQAVALLDQISCEQRHALVLHHVVGMSVPEVAEHLGVPFETVRSRLRLGQAALRALAGADGAGQKENRP